MVSKGYKMKEGLKVFDLLLEEKNSLSATENLLKKNKDCKGLEAVLLAIFGRQLFNIPGTKIQVFEKIDKDRERLYKKTGSRSSDLISPSVFLKMTTMMRDPFVTDKEFENYALKFTDEFGTDREFIVMRYLMKDADPKDSLFRNILRTLLSNPKLFPKVKRETIKYQTTEFNTTAKLHSKIVTKSNPPVFVSTTTLPSSILNIYRRCYFLGGKPFPIDKNAFYTGRQSEQLERTLKDLGSLLRKFYKNDVLVTFGDYRPAKHICKDSPPFIEIMEIVEVETTPKTAEKKILNMEHFYSKYKSELTDLNIYIKRYSKSSLKELVNVYASLKGTESSKNCVEICFLIDRNENYFEKPSLTVQTYYKGIRPEEEFVVARAWKNELTIKRINADKLYRVSIVDPKLMSALHGLKNFSQQHVVLKGFFPNDIPEPIITGIGGYKDADVDRQEEDTYPFEEEF